MLQHKRLYYLDWLRIAAFGILILFHSLQPFTNFNWLLNSEHKTVVADIFTVFFHTWRLHLIFFVSGVGTWLAKRSGNKDFFTDRFLRLIVPFLFGVVLIVPCQYYYQLLQQGSNTSFVKFMIDYPQYLLNKDIGANIFLWIIEIGIHLWYLPYLFIMTLVSFPLLKLIDIRGASESFVEELSKRPVLLMLLALPIILTRIVLQPIFPEYTSVADFVSYGCSFVYGFVYMKHHGRLLPIVQKNNWLLLITGIISSLLIIVFLLIEPLRHAAFNPEYDINHIIVSVPISLSAFSWTLYFVSLFSRKFNFNIRALPQLNRSILPVYIVHQTIIVVAGFYIIKYVNSGFMEFILIILVTVAGSTLAYYIIRMFGVTRFLFGLKNKKAGH